MMPGEKPKVEAELDTDKCLRFLGSHLLRTHFAVILSTISSHRNSPQECGCHHCGK